MSSCANSSLAGGDEELRAHEVDPGDHLGHSVLYLEAGVHLDEVEALVLVDQELHCARPYVADRGGETVRGGGHRVAGRRVKAGGGRLLDELLATALERALALVQVEHLAAASPSTWTST